MTVLSRIKHKEIVIHPRVWGIENEYITIIGSNSQLFEVRIKSDGDNLENWIKKNKILPNAPLKIRNFTPAFKKFEVQCSISADIKDVKNKVVPHHKHCHALVEKINDTFFVNGEVCNDISEELNNFEKYHLVVVKNKSDFDVKLKYTPVVDLKDIETILEINLDKFTNMDSIWEFVGEKMMKKIEENCLFFRLS